MSGHDTPTDIRRLLSTTTTTSSAPAVERDQPSATTKLPPPVWIQSIHPHQAMEPRKVYRYLHLEQFSDHELDDRFHAIVSLSSSAASSSPSSKDPDSQENPSHIGTIDCFTKEQLGVYMERTIQEMEQGNNDKSIVVTSETTTAATADTTIDRVTTKWREEFIRLETLQLWNFLQKDKQDTTIQRQQFVSKLHDSAKAVDIQRIWPLTLSMLMVGSTVGVTTPAMVRVERSFVVGD